MIFRTICFCRKYGLVFQADVVIREHSLTLSLPQAITIGLANSIDPDEMAQNNDDYILSAAAGYFIQ